jgi:hypothetical protein
MWDKMPRHMLAKCAEALTRRMAWPKKLAELYTPEEMAQADNPKTAAQNITAARSASVRPATSRPAQQQNVQDAEIVDDGGVTLAERVDLALDYLTGGNEQAKKTLLIEASRGGKKEGPMLLFAKLYLPETSQPWLKRIMEYLEPMIREKQEQDGAGA